MGKKGIKQYTRIASKYGTKFEGYNLPVGAIYGRVLIPYEKGTEYIFFICTQPKNIRKDTMPIYVLKPSWVSNRWREMLIGREHPAFTAVANICHEIGGIPKIKTFQDPKVAENAPKKPLTELINRFHVNMVYVRFRVMAFVLNQNMIVM